MRQWRGLAGQRADAPSHTPATRPYRCEGCRRDLPRCRWAVAGPGRGNTQTPRPIGGRREACGAWPDNEPTRRAKLAARTASGRAGRAAAGDLSGQRARPHVRRRRKQRKRAAAHRAAARSRSQCNTQRSRAATTSATWTAFRAAPLRRLSPETTSTSPRLPSTAWS